jgi:crotonobetainyl-CoA:carnitine CoA-transferase CaiB-like acyl-CoA transferase
MHLVGHPEVIDEPWFATGKGRAEHGDLLDAYVADWIRERTRDEVVEAFESASAAVAPVYDVAELMEDPHVRATGMFARVPDGDFGAVTMQNLLFRMSATPGEIRFTGRALGADTEDVLREHGIDGTRIASLRERGVVA